MRMFCRMGIWSLTYNWVAQTRHLPSGSQDPQGGLWVPGGPQAERCKEMDDREGGETPALIGLRWQIRIRQVLPATQKLKLSFSLNPYTLPKSWTRLAACLWLPAVRNCSTGWGLGRVEIQECFWHEVLGSCLMEQSLDLSLEPLAMATAPCSWPASPEGDPREEEDVPACPCLTYNAGRKVDSRGVELAAA